MPSRARATLARRLPCWRAARRDAGRATDAGDERGQGHPGGAPGRRPLHGLAHRLHEVGAPEDPLIPPVGLPPPAEGGHGGPAPLGPPEAPALELGPAALGHPGRHEGPVGDPRARPGSARTGRRIVRVSCQGRGTVPSRALCPVQGYRPNRRRSGTTFARRGFR